jgi:hypothetical protein
MAVNALDILTKGLTTLKSKVRPRKEKLQAILAEKKSISSESEDERRRQGW